MIAYIMEGIDCECQRKSLPLADEFVCHVAN